MTMVIFLLVGEEGEKDVTGSLVGCDDEAAGCEAGVFATAGLVVDPHADSKRLGMTIKVRKNNVRFFVDIGPPASF